nr:tetratricopeptide repeat protein [uncultured Methanobrevibacter sp.]
MLEELLDLCEYQYVMGDYKNLIETCDEVLKIKKDEPVSLNYKAISLYYLQRYDESLELLDYCLNLHPTNHYTLNNKALVYIALKDYENALKCAEEGLKSRNLDWLQINKIESLIYLGRVDEAYEYYQSVNIPNYTFEEALDNCGVADNPLKIQYEKLNELFNDKKYEKVVELCDSAKTDEKILNYKIVALIYLERFDEALESVERAIESYPYNPDFHFIKARIYVITKNLDGAIKSYEEAFGIDGLSNNRLEINRYNNCLDIKSKQMIDSGDYDGAITNLEKIIKTKQGKFESIMGGVIEWQL